MQVEFTIKETAKALNAPVTRCKDCTRADGIMKTIQLKPNGLDTGTWAEMKQELVNGWTDIAIDLTDGSLDAMESVADQALAWVCSQLGIEEFEISQEK